ncbi:MULTISPECIES: putative bifunctional diguanylate cyclase/phosphodiesterase [unclassified Halomonas]|uniref:putative bifunctional diguanylate cyclase/phosphodiesterase n=1 Tax=unclassified Halomonas TaxID=2609666 RepID=UPI0007F0B363|nr:MULTISPECIES: GGDEF domain-containing phosphodiesterase [unclassified Halomonas]SBR48749.1 diguanylate cyclase/phosphodiesterase [Halomonas sp. HL-93]SNY96127.1 diguanylate cyclase/phosphodiesterase [Halomonas sp. hl-4]
MARQASTWLLGVRERKTSSSFLLVVLCCIGILLSAGALLVNLTGGTPNENAHFMYVPIFLAAAIYGIVGGVVAGLFAGLMLGPVIGGNIDSISTIITTWGVRALWFMAIGASSGLLIQIINFLSNEQRKKVLHDPSTGLPNQAALIEDLAAQITPESLEKTPIAVVLIRATDHNEFVEVFGIEEGDRIIYTVSQQLNQSCPEVQKSYRFGTSELALIVDYKNDEDLKRVSHLLHAAASATFIVDDVPVRIEPALGFGHVHNETDVTRHPLEIVRRARVALEKAVTLERQMMSYEPDFDTANRDSLELIARAEKGLKAGEFELHYQPKLRLADRHLAGVEALIRWRRPNGEIVPPGMFMPKLERTSLIDAFSLFVIQIGIEYARSGLLVPVSINLTPRNLTNDSLVDALIDSLHESGVPPEYIEVEITESGLMQEPESTIRGLGRLRDHGIGVSIDDFGTGYASFAYLRKLPVTGLKIDREFIRLLEDDAKTRRLVLAMIEAGHALDLTVTAEGIETEQQANILTEFGCDLGQGFLWSPALEESVLCQRMASLDFNHSSS